MVIGGCGGHQAATNGDKDSFRHRHRPQGEGLNILQINLRYCHFGYVLLQQFLQDQATDVILVQDPPRAILSGEGFFRGYEVILSTSFDPANHEDRPLTAILIRSSLPFRRLPSAHSRLCGALISTRRGPVAFISAYIRHTDGDGLGALTHLVTDTRPQTPQMIIGADCNGHSSWWGPPDTAANAVGSLLEDFILHERFTILNRWPCPATFHSDMGHQSWIDLSLSTAPLASAVEDWRILADVDFDSDHSPVPFSLRL